MDQYLQQHIQLISEQYYAILDASILDAICFSLLHDINGIDIKYKDLEHTIKIGGVLFAKIKLDGAAIQVTQMSNHYRKSNGDKS